MKRYYRHILFPFSILLCGLFVSFSASAQAIELDSIPSDSFCVAAPKPLPRDTINWDEEREACIEELRAQAIANAKRAWRDSISTLIEEHINKQKCFSAGFEESFSVRHETTEHHYTLYEYDLAGNLVLTIPPEGVVPVEDQHFSQGIWDGASPAHDARHITKYKYNTLGQITTQITPDAGQTDFFFDRVQRLRFSQNAKQNRPNDYSYTKYDGQSRVIQVGELKNHSLTEAQINDQSFPGLTETLVDTVTTTYDGVTTPMNIPSGNTRGRVAKLENPHMKSYFDYDAHGNVRELTHIVPYLNDSIITLQYDYDLVSGNVNEFRYEPAEEELDKFTQRYLYDADNRLVSAYSSDDGYVFDEDARYFYYLHGPLARMELGEDKVQGLDYLYTLQGWIKGVNMPGADGPGGEIGRDGYVGGHSNLNRYFGLDTMMYSLGYNYDDFTPVGGGNLLSDAVSSSFTDLNSDILGEAGEKGLFNGNIALMITHNGVANQAMAYQYDALHRIIYANSYGWDDGWTSNNDYFIPEITYDANGNIQSREVKSLANTDDLTYHYSTTQPNILDYVSGGGNATGIPTQSAGNYEYDEIGNLIEDNSEGTTMTWDVFGKLRTVNGTGENPGYDYDALGNRMVKNRAGELPTDIYVRDASGYLIAIYENQYDMSGNIKDRLIELNVYGSSRLGVIKLNRLVYDKNNSSNEDTIRLASSRHMRSYELNNHLGNTLTTISDQKVGVDGVVDGLADFYSPRRRTTADYFPFGMEMEERTIITAEPPEVPPGDYRFGFNGKEKDSFICSLTHYDYGFRIYNPAIGRFLSVDPLTKDYPMLTPYQFASNTPVQAVDIDGLEAGYVRYYNVVIDEKGSFKTTPATKPILETTEGAWSGRRDVSKFIHNDKLYDSQFQIPGWAKFREAQHEKAKRTVVNGLIITGGVFTTIASGGTGTAPYVALFGTSTGLFAITGGTSKLVLDLQGDFEESDLMPTSLLEGMVIPFIDNLENERAKNGARTTAGIIDALITLDPLSYTKSEPNIFTEIGNGVSVLNITISGVGAVEKKDDIPQETKNDQQKKKPKT